MTAINNETTELIVKLDSSGDISEDGSSSNALSTKNSFDSLRASARSFSDALSESMQRIGFLGSISIAVNSLTGPAMLCLPDTYQRSGLIPTTGMTIDVTTNFGRFSLFRLLSGCCFRVVFGFVVAVGVALAVVTFLDIFVSISHKFCWSHFKFTAVIIFVCILSAFCCLHMSNTISKVPNNHTFGLDVSHIWSCRAI